MRTARTHAHATHHSLIHSQGSARLCLRWDARMRPSIARMERCHAQWGTTMHRVRVHWCAHDARAQGCVQPRKNAHRQHVQTLKHTQTRAHAWKPAQKEAEVRRGKGGCGFGS
eukprot:5902265-Pleurochrysis_carterae.AAC.2